MKLLVLYRSSFNVPFMVIYCDTFNTFAEGVTFTIDGHKQSIIVDWDYYEEVNNHETAMKFINSVKDLQP